MRFLNVLLVCALVCLPGPAAPAQDTPPPPAPAETPATEPGDPPPADAEPPSEEDSTEAEDETAPDEEDETEADATGDEDEEKERKKANKTQATLKIETDLDCMVTVGIQPAQEVTPDEPLTVKVDPGPIQVRANAIEAPEAGLLEQLVVEAGDRQRIRFKMAKALTDLRKIEARDRIDLDWEAAGVYCEQLQHGGWEDWRLPTLQELEDIDAMWSLRPFKTADPISLTSCCPWSSDRIDEENAWNYLRALCVRDGSDEIPENTRRNRRLAKKEAKEQKRERLARQAEREAEKEAAALAAAAAEAAEEDDGEPDDGDGGGGSRL